MSARSKPEGSVAALFELFDQRAQGSEMDLFEPVVFVGAREQRGRAFEQVPVLLGRLDLELEAKRLVCPRRRV